VTSPVLIGDATLDPAVLVDSLVPDLIDGLRDDLLPAFGVRSYRCFRVITTWTGKEAGEGQVTYDTAELRPQPRVMVWDGMRFVQAMCGIRELGEVRLSEISLTYTEAQLTGRGAGLGRNQEQFIGITDAHGQGTEARLFGMTAPAFVDREKTMGWMLYLRVVDGAPSWAP